MAVLRLDRIMTARVDAEEMVASNAALAAAAKYASVQTTHPGTIRLDGDTAAGRAYIAELGRFRDGSSHLNHAVYHDRYQRTPGGWKFTERVYEIKYLDTTPLTGSAPDAAPGPMRES